METSIGLSSICLLYISTPTETIQNTTDQIMKSIYKNKFIGSNALIMCVWGMIQYCLDFFPVAYTQGVKI
jgi:hypothetical protein